MNVFWKIYREDFLRYKRVPHFIPPLWIAIQTIASPALICIYAGRKVCFAKNKLQEVIWRTINKCVRRRYGNEIDFSQIGEGIVLKHPYCITVAAHSKLGKNVTLFKGSTVGSIRSGAREGCPTIGDHVVVCSNAMVCGNIRIGNDVLICANAFVNFDVPDHSVVIGNPATIHYKMGAADDYRY